MRKIERVVRERLKALEEEVLRAEIVELEKSLADAQAQIEALQGERDKLREATKVICGHCCEPMAIPSKAILQSQLSQLQALVRAAVSAPGKDWLEWQLKLGEALDATPTERGHG